MPAGRPTKYKEEMINTAKDYIKDCPDFVPSLVGLSMILNVCESTLNKWKALDVKDLSKDDYPRFDEFLQILHKLHDFQKQSALNGGANGKWNSTIAKLILGLHGIKESKDLTTDGKPITPQIVVFNDDTK
jgi:hypothetical protein